MLTALRVLIVEDHPTDAELMVEELRRGGFEPSWQRVETESDYLARLAENPSVILADYNLPQFDAPRALRLLQERGLDIPFLVVSGEIGEEVAVAIMREGASDYLLKDRMGRLAPAVTAVLEKKRLREENLRAEEARHNAELRYREIFENAIEGICQRTPHGQVLAANPAMARMLGYSSPGEVIEASWNLERLHADPERCGEYLRLLQEGDSIRGFECQLRRKDQTTIWVSLNTRVLRDGSGEVVHYNCTMVDITELKAIEAALDQSRQELRDLAARLLAAQETESRRLGRELHDAFSQKLAILGIDVGLLRSKPPDSQEALEVRLASVRDKISELAKGLQETSRTLHPSILYDLGLYEALKQECDAFAGRHEIAVKCRSRNLPERLPDDTSLCLYRIVQESLWNIRKHARAREVRVALRGSAGEIVLTIEDDGHGFVRDSVRGKGGLGLVSMEERVRLVRGRLSIVSRPGLGTRVEVRVPAQNST